MFTHSLLTRRFWLITLSLLAVVSQPVEADAVTKFDELNTLLLPTNQEQGSVIKVVKDLPNTVKANESITYTLTVTNLTDRILLDVIVYEILPSEADFEYQTAIPSPIPNRPVVLRDLDQPKETGGSSTNSRVLTFRWDEDRIFQAGETRTITITGIVKKQEADPKILLAARFCTAAQYVMGFCKGVTTAELKLFKQFVFNDKVVPNDGSVPKYPRVCGEATLPDCLAKDECLKCSPRNPEWCTFGVQIWGQNTGTTAVSNLTLTDKFAPPIVVHETGEGQINQQFLITLQPGITTDKLTHHLRAECLSNNIGTPAQVESENPVLKVDSNIPKINVTSSDLVVTARAPALDAGTRHIAWTIQLENKGNRAAQNIVVEANFSSSEESVLVHDKGVRKGSNITWKVPRLEAKDFVTFNVAQELAKAKGYATVNVQATSDCDCDKASKTASSINYAMVVEMIDINDPFRPKFVEDEATIQYRLTVCNQVKPLGDRESAFDFAFTGGLYGPDDLPAKYAVNAYAVKFERFAILNEYDEVQSHGAEVPSNDDPHYQTVSEPKNFSEEWQGNQEFRFGSMLKGRHCAKFNVGVQINKRLANGKHSLHLDVRTLAVPVSIKAEEIEPTTVER